MDVSYIYTVKNGLCSKLELENPFSSTQIVVESNLQGMDKLTNVSLMIAAKNTWQGIISNYWPLTKTPPLITEEFVPKVIIN